MIRIMSETMNPIQRQQQRELGKFKFDEKRRNLLNRIENL